MPQSNVIFAFLFISFLVWITMRGELPTYLNYLLHAKAVGSTPAAAQRTSSGTQSQSDSTASGISPTLAASFESITAAAAILG